MREPFSILPQSLQIFFRVLWVIYALATVVAFQHSNLIVVAGLVIIFALAGLIKPVPNPLGGISDPNSGLVIPAALLWQPGEVLLGVGIGSFIGLLIFRKNELWRAANNAAGWGLPALCAGLVAHGTISHMQPGLIALITGAVVAVITYRVVNTTIFAVYRSQRFNRPLFADLRDSLVMQWPSHLLAAPMAVVLAAVAGRTGTLWSGLGLTAVYMGALPFARQEYAYYIRAREMLDETVEAMVRALEGVDPGARRHGDRVGTLAEETGRRLGMSERELLALRLAGRLHDVGILAEADEESAGEQHAAVGGRILAQFPEPLIGRFVRGHHERWDGSGMPDRLRGDAIPLGARILAAAEIYDSARSGLAPFDTPSTSREAAHYLQAQAGGPLDPKVVGVLLKAAERLDAAQKTSGQDAR